MKEFTSQACTTIKQSKRLLDLGLKPETADMGFFRSTDEDIEEPYTRLVLEDYIMNPLQEEDTIPAWSLHRLLEMLCNKECEEHYYFDFSMDYDSMEDAYDSIIEVIERHIKNEFFNKEYLKR